MGKLDEAIQHLAKTKDVSFFKSELCTVLSVTVNSNKKVISCESINSDSVFSEVDLSAEDNDGFIMSPKVGSNVIIGFSSKVDPFVMMFSEIDKVILTAGNSEVYMDTSVIKMNGGDNGGMTKIDVLVNKLNTLENDMNALVLNINAIVTAFNAHTHNVTAVGSPTGPVIGPATPSTVAPIIPTVKLEIENTKVKH